MRTIEISDELYTTIANEMTNRRTQNAEDVLRLWHQANVEKVEHRMQVLAETQALRQRLWQERGTFSDSTELIREDRER